LKLKYDAPLSTVPFNVNLRCYATAFEWAGDVVKRLAEEELARAVAVAGGRNGGAAAAGLAAGAAAGAGAGLSLVEGCAVALGEALAAAECDSADAWRRLRVGPDRYCPPRHRTPVHVLKFRLFKPHFFTWHPMTWRAIYAWP